MASYAVRFCPEQKEWIEVRVERLHERRKNSNEQKTGRLFQRERKHCQTG